MAINNLRLFRYLIEEMGCFVHSVFTDKDVLLAGSFRPSFTEGVQVHHTAAAYYGIKGDNLVDWHSENLNSKSTI